MNMKKILQKESPVLREISQSIPVDKISSPKIQKILMEMKKVLASQDDGVALAAPQIGYPLRIFVVSRKVNVITRNLDDSEIQKFQDTVYINPVLKKISKEKKVMEEGCLSVRFLYGKVKRGEKATVQAYDEKGKKFERGGTGLLAQIYQHEIDHLDGILFIDKAKFVEEILPTKKNGAK